MIKYCTKCMLPETKPELTFQDGVCNACINYENRKNINWEEKKKHLLIF